MHIDRCRVGTDVVFGRHIDRAVGRFRVDVLILDGLFSEEPITLLGPATLWGCAGIPVPGRSGRLRQYVGGYELNADFVIAVTREGERFYVQAVNQQRLETFAASEVDFFLRTVQASVTFGRGDLDGPVTHVIPHQGGDRRLERRR